FHSGVQLLRTVIGGIGHHIVHHIGGGHHPILPRSPVEVDIGGKDGASVPIACLQSKDFLILGQGVHIVREIQINVVVVGLAAIVSRIGVETVSVAGVIAQSTLCIV